MNERSRARRGLRLLGAIALVSIVTLAAPLARPEKLADDPAAEWQRQIDELDARPTYRGWVVILGDVLFTRAQADLEKGASGNLDKLVNFLNEYPSRTVVIEGYTDSAGSELYNQELSQRRADSVRTYLVARGIHPVRLFAAGKGESAPLAGNESAAGRQQNRRVEITINNLPAAALR